MQIRIRFVLKIVFACLYITPSHYHHCANLPEDIELIKCLSDIFCRVCEQNKACSLSNLLYNTWGCLFSIYPLPCDDWANIYTWSYYHHQIGSMNYYPLFRVRSWNNGVRCMSFCIPTIHYASMTLQKQNCRLTLFKSPQSEVTLCFQFVSAAASASAAAAMTYVLTSTPFELDLRYLEQRKYRFGTMYWMTIGWPWPKVTAVTLINKNCLSAW